ncbi:MAG TPA: hypothetical protein VJ890_08635, partial [Vineibacter sp.]|nr:hypothetical protein [Vineibacter sp.]
MAWRRITRRVATFVAAGLVLLFGGLQTGLGQRLLFNTVASLASTPGQAIRLDGPSGFFPTDMKLARVEVADGKGVWLAADDVSMSWSLWPLLAGRFDVQALRAARLAIHRAPETTTTEGDAPSGSGPPQFPRVTVESLAIDELRLGAALTGAESRWRLEGTARLDGMGANNALSLAAARSDDRRGRLDLRARFDATRGEAHADGNFEEGEGGVLAALLGRPDLPRTAGTFTLQASRDGGDGRITLDAGDALHVSGSGRMRPEDSGRHIVLSLEIRGGQLPYPTWAAALDRPATVDADLLLGPTGAIELRTLRIASVPLAVTASGRYDQDTEHLQLRLEAIGGDPAVLAALMPGAAWRDMRIELQAAGKLAALDATLSLRAAELDAPQARATDVELTASTQGANLSAAPILRATLKGSVGTLAWRADKDPLVTRDVRFDATIDR